MKSSKSEVFYLVLSAITVIVGVVIYHLFGNYNTTEKVDTRPKTVQQDKKKKTDSKDNQSSDAESLIEEFEKNPTNNGLATVQEAIAKLDNEEKKAELQAKVEALQPEIDNQVAAEQAVNNAEGYQVQYNVDLAQASLDTLTNNKVKESLQKRLDTVIANIEAQTVAAPVAPTLVATEVVATELPVSPAYPVVEYVEASEVAVSETYQ